jgi:hypothetical protein
MASLADLLTQLQDSEGQTPRAPWRGPGERPAPGANAPDPMPKWYRDVQPYPVNVPAAIEGLGAVAGVTGGPANAVRGGLQYGAEIARSAATSPMALALGGGALATLLGAGSTNSGELSALDRLLQQQKDLSEQRATAQRERDAQMKGGGGRRPGVGPAYDAANADIARLDAQLGQLQPLIAEELKRKARADYLASPEGKLEMEREQKKFAEEQAKAERGKPTREKLPEWAQDFVIPAAGVAGAGITYGLTRRGNNQYNAAVERFMKAQKAGNPAEMALAQEAVKALESPSLASTLTKYTAAGLPAEVRMYELYNDLKKDPESRAFKEADKRIHDPMMLGLDIGGSLASSLIAYGLGSKLAPTADRAMGAAIAKRNPYENAPSLADGLATAQRAGEGLRKLGPDGAGELPRLLQAEQAKGLPAPTPTAAQPSSGGNLPAPLEGPGPVPAASANQPAPQSPLIKPDARGVPYDTRTGHKIPKKYYDILDLGKKD